MKSVTNLSTWEYSAKSESERLLHSAHQIAVGFYHVNNFIVLPYTSKLKNVNLVTFPDLPFVKIKRFWDEVKKVDITTLPIKCPKKLLDETIELFSKSNIAAPNYTKTKTVWNKAQDEIIKEVYKIIPSKKDKIKKIIIYPTKFGTSCSFNRINKKGEIIIYLREDQGIATLVEAIITSLTRQDIYQDLDGIWQESEIITDWLITQSSLSEIIAKYDKGPFLPTLKGVRIKQQAKLIEESDEFYKKLGLPTAKNIFGLNGLVPEIDKKPLENLSPTEKIILRLLIQKAGGVVKFDEFANEIFKNDESYSLYAISKNIERLRNKLEQNGISGSYIQTLRGKGYVLKN